MKGESPEAVKLSLAAAMQLGYSPARFHRGARMTCINLLLTYTQGCAANCSYCGLARERQVGDDRSFIRVPWPVKQTEDVIARIARSRVVHRTCLSMITHRRSVRDTLNLTRRLRERTPQPISVLVAPILVQRTDLVALREAGADRLGVAFDLPTESLFDHHRGRAARGPLRWANHWRVFDLGVEVFGERMVGSHFVVGLGETEREMAQAFQEVHDRGGVNHLFSFYPEPGSALASCEPPPMVVYRRIQISCELIDSGLARVEDFKFDEQGCLTDFGIAPTVLERVIESGEPFRTRGCPGPDGEVACNRPFANSFPGDLIRNYPFPPDGQDLARIRRQMVDA